MTPKKLWQRLVGRGPGSSDGTGAGPGSNPALVATLQTLMNTRDMGRLQSMIKEHPEVLSSEADELLARSSDERTKGILDEYRQLFELCRQHGVEMAFVEVERRKQEHQDTMELLGRLVRVVNARDIVELKRAIRQDPRLIGGQVRGAFRAFLAAEGTFGIPNEHIQRCLEILERCEQQGIDVTLGGTESREVAAPLGDTTSNADGSQAIPLGPAEAATVFNTVVRSFHAGGAEGRVAREALNAIVFLPPVLRISCILVAMLASLRAGNGGQARTLAVKLAAQASGADLPGIPHEAVGLAVAESKDLGPVLEALDLMSGQADATQVERASLDSLKVQYAQLHAQRLS